MLLTTCPNCGAKFKVSPEQLNVRQGRVMCGRCRHVFNAFEALKRIQDTEAGEPIDYALVDSRRSEPDVADPPIQQADAPEIAESSAPPPVPIAQSSEDEPAAQEAFDSYEEALKKLERAESVSPTSDLRDFVEPAPAASPLDAETPAISESLAPETTADDSSTTATPPVVEPTYVAASDNPLISGALPRQSPPSAAWGWLAALAAVCLLAQTLYYFRSAIVQQYPQLRPQFVAACDVIGCRVSWGRTQELIKIESSDLIEPPGRPGRILLTATLVNRGTTKQDFPALEVKLTDAGNSVVSSRILMPAEYLGRAIAPDEGLAPNVELYVNLNLELVGKAPASGYGLRAFYPE